jgi:hypothetical protein
VATFTDSDPAGTAGEFSAEARWSDGNVTPATVTSSGGYFIVSAAHTFSSPGDLHVEVRILGLPTARDVGGSEAIVTSVIHSAEITAPSNLCATLAANASVSVDGIATAYAWTIENGSILGGQGTGSIRFTTTAAGPVELRVSASVDGCVVSTTKTVQASACFRGDANGDHIVSTADAFFLIDHLFAGGPAPGADGDVNLDGTINLDDLTFLTSYLFADGPPPLP